MSYPVKKTKADFEYNGVKYSADVTISYNYDMEDVNGSFDYGDPEENAKELARFESGELQSLYLMVNVSACGVSVTESLGAVWVNTYAKESTDDQLMEIVKGDCMVEEALNQLVKVLTKTANDLKPFQTA